jgi:putative nucleotidyltransferase-like protein
MLTDVEVALCALVREQSRRSTPIDKAIDDGIVTSARAHRLHLVLAQHVDRGDLAADMRAAAAVDAARQRELGRTLTALAAAGICPICIKGAAIAHTHYHRPEMRPRLDTDLLIAPDAREAATRVLRAVGYERPVETGGDLCTSQLHLMRVDSAGIDHQLDVHWRISNVLALAGVLTYADVAARACALPQISREALAPCATHSLLIACVHRVAHHRDSANLLWLYDVALLADSLDEADRTSFAALATERRVRAVCAASLRRAGDAFGGAAGDLARRVAPPDGAPDEPSAALLSPRLRLVDLLAVDMRSLDSWSKRVQLVREHVFPSRAYMLARYGPGRPLAWRYLQRIAGGAPKWFRS